MHLIITFKDLEFASWPNTELRYKHGDGTNRIKLLEDVIKDVFGWDDSQHMIVTVQKRQGPTVSTEVRLFNLLTEPFVVQDDSFMLPALKEKST